MSAPLVDVDPSSLPVSPIVGTSGSASSSLGWQEPPSTLKLVQVHYLVRHGERTPVRTRLLNAQPPVPPRWNMCHAGKDFQATVLDLAGPSKVVHAQDWKKQIYSGAPTDMKIKRRVESTDAGAQNILETQAGEW